jgi:hypothetical protein
VYSETWHSPSYEVESINLVVDHKMTEPGFWYVATVYTKHPKGLDIAFEEACYAAGVLRNQGLNVFCPIAMGHAIAVNSPADKHDWAMWMENDRPFMRLAYGLIVVMMPNWQESKGIAEEIEVIKKAGKPIKYVHWPDMGVLDSSG